MQSATFEIGRYLIRKNWNVHIITNRYPRALKSYETISELKVFRYIFLSNPIQYFLSGRIDMFFAWFFLKPINLMRLIDHFIRFKPKVVNIHFPDHQLLECYLLMLLFRFKIIISVHGNEVERMHTLSKKSIKYFLYNKLFISANKITGCSQYLLNKLHESFPHLDHNDFVPQHNGVNEKYFEQPLFASKNENIFSAARFIPKKGLDLLLEASQKFSQNQLHIAGGDDSDFLTLGLKKREGLFLLGQLSQDDLANNLAQAKLTIIPSREEPYGIIVAEALCCGSPVVATNVGGIPEVIALATEKLSPNEKEIFDSWVKLVKPNIDSIKKGIDALLNNNGAIEDYINLVPKFRNNFIWEKRLENYLKLINTY